MSAKSNKSLVGAIIFASIVISGSLVFLGIQTNGAMTDDEFGTRIEAWVQAQQAAAQGGQGAQAGAVRNVSADDDAIKGDKDAPVTIIEFSDYQCPFCQRFAVETLPQIQANYIDTGKVNLVYRDFPISSHADAMPAAIAAECARDQGGDDSYYDYHDQIFANSTRSMTPAILEGYAANLSLNAAEFSECLSSQKFLAEAQKDLQEGQAAGVSGTPAFFVNGRFIEGAQPYATFEAAIEDALKN